MTATATNTATPTPTTTYTPTNTATKTPTPTNTPTVSSTPTVTATATLTPSSTPTRIPLPTATSVDCDRAIFVDDITVPDGSLFGPGETFIKTWRLRNDGDCAWTTDYQVVFVDGERMSAPLSFALPRIVAPGQTIDIGIRMRTPIESGSYRGNFKLQNDAGILFGTGKSKNDPFWLEIKVQQSITTFDFVDSYCAAEWLSGAGTLPCPGRDGSIRGFVRRINNPGLEDGTIYTSPGLLTSPQGVENGYIMGIYPPYRVRKGDHFQSIVSCEADAQDCFVVFRLDYRNGSDAIQTFWAFVEQYEEMYYQADIDLSSFAGQDVNFILSVLAVGSADGDRAIWGAPQIVHKFDTPTTIPNPLFPLFKDR